MNSFTGIFDTALSPTMLPPCIDSKTPTYFEEGTPCLQRLWETLSLIIGERFSVIKN